MKTIKLIGLVLAFGLMLTSANAQTSKFAALAIDKANGFYYGWAYDHPSLAEAEKRAMAECTKRGGKCSVVLSFSGTGCGVYRTVKGEVGTAYGWGIAATQAEADKIATSEALKRSNGKPAENFVFGCNSGAKETLKIIQNESNQANSVAQVGHTGSIYDIAFSPDGKMIASSDGDQTVKLWDVNSGRVLKTFTTNPSSHQVLFLADGKRLVARSLRFIYFYDLPSGELSKTITHDHFRIKFSADGKTFVTSEYDTITIWNTDSFEKVKTIQKSNYNSQDLISNDLATYIYGDLDGSIKLFDIATATVSKSLAGHRGERSVNTLAISNDRKIIASEGDDRTIKLWDVASGQELKSLLGDKKRTQELVFSPDGKILVSAGNDKTIKFWDVASGQELKSFTAHSSWVVCLAISRDGKTIASGGDKSDPTIKLWDVASGQEIRTLK